MYTEKKVQTSSKLLTNFSTYKVFFIELLKIRLYVVISTVSLHTLKVCTPILGLLPFLICMCKHRLLQQALTYPISYSSLTFCPNFQGSTCTYMFPIQAVMCRLDSRLIKHDDINKKRMYIFSIHLISYCSFYFKMFTLMKRRMIYLSFDTNLT